MQEELIFVYNANSGKLNAYLDTMHKIFSPKTYSCNLCAITYGNFGMKKEWAEFIDQIAIPMRFLHKDEWEKEFQRNDELPAVFLRKGNDLKVFISAEEMDTFSLEQLKVCIEDRLMREN